MYFSSITSFLQHWEALKEIETLAQYHLVYPISSLSLVKILYFDSAVIQNN